MLNKFKNSADIPFLRSAPHTLNPGHLIALLLDVVEDTFDTYRQINLADIQAEFGGYVATRLGL
jgi:hypothetical protein